MSPARRHTHIHKPRSYRSPSQPHFHFNRHWFIDFCLRGWWAAPFIWTVFISSLWWLFRHQSEKSNPLGQAYYLPPLPYPCRNPASSNETVTGNAGGRAISEMSLFGSECRLIKTWLCLKQDSPLFLVFLTLLKNIFPIHVLFLALELKNLFCSWKLTVWCGESIKSMKNTNKRCVLVIGVHCTTLCVSLYSALKCCDIYFKRRSNERFLQFFTQVRLWPELNRKQFLRFLSIIPSLLSLTSYPIGPLSQLMTSGC